MPKRSIRFYRSKNAHRTLSIIKLRGKIHCITIFSICKQIFIKKEKDLLYRSFNTFAFYHKNGGSKPPPYGLPRYAIANKRFAFSAVILIASSVEMPFTAATASAV